MRVALGLVERDRLAEQSRRACRGRRRAWRSSPPGRGGRRARTSSSVRSAACAKIAAAPRRPLRATRRARPPARAPGTPARAPPPRRRPRGRPRRRRGSGRRSPRRSRPRRGRRRARCAGRRQMACAPLAAARASRRRRGGRGPAGSRTGRARASAGRPAAPSTSLRTSDGEQRLELVRAESPRARPAPSRVNVLPSTAPSWSSRRSSGESPSSRAAISACSVSGTSSSPISPTGR